VVYQEMLKRGEAGREASADVHEWSTTKAETLLVAAINAQKDIIFDGAAAGPGGSRGLELCRQPLSHAALRVLRIAATGSSRLLR